MSTTTSTEFTTVIRHFCVATRDLTAASLELHEFFGVPHQPTATYIKGSGFVTEGIMVGTTMIEVVEPVWPHHYLRDVLAEEGPNSHKIVLQTNDMSHLRATAVERGLRLNKDGDFRGQRWIEFGVEHFGTRWETYQYDLPNGWWGGGKAHEPSTVASDITGLDVAIADPAAMTREVSEIFEAPADLENNRVTFTDPAGLLPEATGPLVDKTVSFVPSDGGRLGVVAIDLVATDRSRVGEVVPLQGVNWRFV